MILIVNSLVVSAPTISLGSSENSALLVKLGVTNASSGGTTINYINATYTNITNNFINQSSNWNESGNTFYPSNLSRSVGIGTTSSAYDLEVRNEDGVNYIGQYTNDTYLTISSGAGNANATLLFREATAVRYKIFYDGFQSLFQIYNFAIDKVVMAFKPDGKIEMYYNLTAPNICYSNGSNCQAITGTNYTSDEIYINKINNNFTFNESKLSTTYYNANQSQAVAGTIDGGTLADTQHPDGRYDSLTFNFSEVSATPGLDLRINFTNITSFSQGVMRYKTSSGLNGAYPIIQMWNYDTSLWEDYPPVAEIITFHTIEQPVFDSAEHVSGGVAQMRIYKATKGNTGNHYYVDWIAIAKGFGIPNPEEIDPYSYHTGQNLNLNAYNLTNVSYIQFQNGVITNGTWTWFP